MPKGKLLLFSGDSRFNGIPLFQIINMKKIFIVLAGMIWLSFPSVIAQDIHFSQYFASPLYINPAMTGGYNGVFRAHLNYRNQWFTVSDQPYVTYAGGADFALLRKKLGFDQMGVGLLVYSDRAGAGILVNQSVLLSFAYHKVLDQQNKYSLSLGVQGGVGQKRVDINRLRFEEQFDPNLNDFNEALSNGEVVNDNSILYPDINAGIQFKARFSQNLNTYIGFSYGHLNRPKESFLVNDQDNRLASRAILHAGADIVVVQDDTTYRTEQRGRVQI
jgi:type IX secretion system PorP/SprF family membrane protein